MFCTCIPHKGVFSRIFLFAVFYTLRRRAKFSLWLHEPELAGALFSTNRVRAQIAPVSF
jgi:hypothetical protein